jgi:large subunit ribosomal protein L6
MSRVGKKPIIVPSGVEVTLDGLSVIVKGPKGQLERTLHHHVMVTREEDALTVTVKDPEEKNDRALWGLSRQLLSNMIDGVTEGFEKKLELVGVGYKAAVSGSTLTMHLGYSHPIDVPIPEGVEVSVEKNTNITIAGINNEVIGNLAASVRALRKPEPYKGKGVKYAGEVIRRKLGKAAKSAT